MKSAGFRIRKPKERGEWAELMFMARAAEKGFKLAKPWGDSAPYDVTVERGGEFLRVQVKSTMCEAHPKKPHHQRGVFVANMRHISIQRYRASDFDYLAVYVIPRNVWYIIPSEVATRKGAIRVAPSNPRNQYERFREAWRLLRNREPSRKQRGGITMAGAILHSGF